MIDGAQTLDRIFSSAVATIIFLCVGIAVIVGLFLNSTVFVRKGEGGKSSRHGKHFKTCAAALLTLVSSAFGVIGYLRLAANDDIDAKLKSGVLSVLVEGKHLAQADSLVQSLLTSCNTSSRRSHPTTRYDVHIETRLGPLALQLGQDSETDGEYWVFYPGFRLTQINEVRRACDTGSALAQLVNN